MVDFNLWGFDVNAGVGYGLTPGSDRLMAKMIIGTDLTEGLENKSADGAKPVHQLSPCDEWLALIVSRTLDLPALDEIGANNGHG